MATSRRRRTLAERMAAAPTSRAALDLSAEEKDFQRSVIETFEWAGWRIYHSTDSRLDTIYGETGRGWPDCVAMRHRDGKTRLVVAELKREGEGLSGNQLVWFALWSSFPGAEVYSWWPRDMDRIMDVAR